MATDYVLNVTFDGVNSVQRLPGQGASEFFDRFLGYYSVYDSDPDHNFIANVSFVGADWRAATVRFGAALTNTLNLTDGDDSTGRRIDFLQLGYNSKVELISTNVRYIFGWDGDSHDITLGTSGRSVSAIEVYAAENIIRTGGDWVRSISTGGTDTIEIGDGGAGMIDTGNGNARVTTTGSVEAVKTHDGDDVVEIGGGAVSVRTNGGNDTVRVTGDNDVNLIFTYDGNDVVNTLAGGAGFVRTENGNDKVNTGSGYVKAIETGNDNDKVSIGAGGAGLVETGDGRDVIKTGAGWVKTIDAGDGNDKVLLGGGSGGFVRLGSGDDSFVMRETQPDYGVTATGGGGTDTISFAKFSKGVLFTLDSDGAWQNPAAPGGDLDLPGRGYVRAHMFENVVGSKKNDTLFGNSGDNKLTGGKGADVLDGGGGNDAVRGQGGADIFVFGPDSGTDRVLDFQDGTDLLRLVGHIGTSVSSLDISKVGADKQIIHDGGTIILVGGADVKLTLADFDFV